MAAGSRTPSKRSSPVNTLRSSLRFARQTTALAGRDETSVPISTLAPPFTVSRFAVLLVAAGLGTAACCQQTDIIHDDDPGAAFRHFLESPPWIKRIVYGRSGDQFTVIVGKGTKGRPHDGVAWYEAALQPSTCYLKALSNSVAGTDNLSGDGSIVGRADKLYWALAADHAELVFSRAEEDPTEFPQSLESSMDEVRSILKLGILHLQPGTLRWKSRDSFEADSAGDRGRILGTITDKDAGRPARLEYTVTGVPGYKFVIRYAYYSDAPFPPSEIALVSIGGGEQTPCGTNFIRELETGEFRTGFAGFRPSYFVPEITNTLRTLRFISNGILFSVKPDGRIISLGKGVIPDFSRLEGGPQPRTRALFYAVAVVICLAVWSLLWWGRRHAGRSM